MYEPIDMINNDMNMNGFRNACISGNYELVEYLTKIHETCDYMEIDIAFEDNFAINHARKKGNFKILYYLQKLLQHDKYKSTPGNQLNKWSTYVVKTVI